jgi:hypothetical protein
MAVTQAGEGTAFTCSLLRLPGDDCSPRNQALAGHLWRRIQTQEIKDRRRHIGEPSAVAQRHLPFVQP